MYRKIQMNRKENFISNWIENNYVEGAEGETGMLSYVTYNAHIMYEKYIQQLLDEINKKTRSYKLNVNSASDNIWIDVEITRAGKFITINELSRIIKTLNKKCDVVDIMYCKVTHDLNIKSLCNVLHKKEYTTENLSLDYIMLKYKQLYWHHKRFTNVKFVLW